MSQGTLRLQCSSSVEDVLQPQIHLAHPVDRGRGRSIQEYGRGGHIFTGPGEGGKPLLLMVGCHGPTSLERRLALAWVGQSSLSCHSLTDEFA
jgi:hypothetical protein